MLTRRTDAFRIAAEAIEHICAAEALDLDPTVDAAIRNRLATVTAATGIPERTAVGYVAPETLAAHLASTLITAHQLNQQTSAQANDQPDDQPTAPPTGCRRDALVYTTAPADTVCVGCEEPIAKGEPVVSAPGLYGRGFAHETCAPDIWLCPAMELS